MLSSGQIMAMRATADCALPDVAIIWRRATVSDGGGGQTEVWNPIATVACRSSPVAGGEGAIRGDRIEDEATQIVTVPALTDVTEVDRLVINSVTYNIKLVRLRGEWAITQRLEVKEAS